MKVNRSILTLFAAISSLGIASAQTSVMNWDLTFKHKFPSDTVQIGQTVTVVDSIFNLGPGDFPGGTYTFNYTINNEKASELFDQPSTFTITIPPITNKGVAVTKSTFKIEANDYTKKDGSNIVIIWPTGDVIDTYKDNNYWFDLLFAKEAEDRQVGIESAGLDLAPKFTVYPNPVTSSSANINFSGLRRGNYTLQVIDADGRSTVLTAPIVANDLGNAMLPASTFGASTGVVFLRMQHQSTGYWSTYTLVLP